MLGPIFVWISIMFGLSIKRRRYYISDGMMDIIVQISWLPNAAYTYTAGALGVLARLLAWLA
jgi:hypothetical protein